MGPWDAIGHIIVGLWQTHKLEHWAKVVISCGLVTLNTFLGGCGWHLAHGEGFATSIGSGMMYASAALYLFAATSPLMRGTAIAAFKPALDVTPDVQVAERK